jgi:hypothetical protein
MSARSDELIEALPKAGARTMRAPSIASVAAMLRRRDKVLDSLLTLDAINRDVLRPVELAHLAKLIALLREAGEEGTEDTA